jgi:hypothetical protein
LRGLLPLTARILLLLARLGATALLLLAGLLARVLILLTLLARLVLIGHLEISRWWFVVRDNSLDAPMVSEERRFHLDYCAAVGWRGGDEGTLP